MHENSRQRVSIEGSSEGYKGEVRQVVLSLFSAILQTIKPRAKNIS